MVVEPWLTDQWYVSTQPLAGPAIAAVEDGRIQFVPKQYENMYFSWMRDIQDWCISRQLWWGHRIPVWTCLNDGEIIVTEEETLTECPTCGGTKLQPEALNVRVAFAGDSPSARTRTSRCSIRPRCLL